MAHSFGKFCVDKDGLVAKETLKDFMDVLLKQSNKDEALIPYHDQLPDVDDGKTIKAPRYFGAGGEFLSECFFEVYGADYNLTGIVSYDDEEIARTDGGVDQEARSRKEKIYTTRLNTKAMPNTPIYIQVKTAVNPTKVFTTNDGSRIMNFFGHAQGLARAQAVSFNARYILFTTGKELHWVLKRNTFNMIEVVGYKDIKKRVDKDRVFWNHMRKKFGLPLLDLPPPPMDPEYKSILAEIESAKCD
jgi:hypothetical protein